jgi:hypothetical protein
MTENEDPLVTYTRDKFKNSRSGSVPNPDAPWVPTDAMKVAPGEGCPVCKGGPLDGHVAGRARLAGDLPLEVKQLRLWLGLALIKLGARVTGMKVDVEKIDADKLGSV